MIEPFETKRLFMRPLKFDDAHSIYEYARDPLVAQYVSWDAHKSIEDSRTYISYAMTLSPKPGADLFAITFKDDPDTVIGTVCIETKGSKVEGELSWALGRQYWRQGIMYEAAHALIERAFDTYQIERIFAICDPPNIASKALMNKLGMKYEGCLRSKIFEKGRFWDLEYYSILMHEWGQVPDPIQFDDYTIEYSSDLPSEDIAVLAKGISDNARLKKGMEPIEHFGFFVKDNDQVLAGCNGVMYYGCLYIDQLWVTEELRGKGIAKRLLQSAEDLGHEKGCSMSTINTMDWEALGLYQKLGYEVEIARDGYSNNSTFYLLRKKF